MAIIPQLQLFSWQDIEELGDLERLRLVLEHLPDEPLMQTLEKKRGRGRNDYPVRAVWNSVLAGVVLQHQSLESLRRELRRNAQLRQLCGFEVARGVRAVPSSSAYSRFLVQLFDHQQLIDAMFNQLVAQLVQVLPDFGQVLATDGKALESHARGRKQSTEQPAPDGRRDTDADWGVHTYRGTNEDGSQWERTSSWFGYKLHLVVDAVHELPVAYALTPASASEVKQAHRLVDKLAREQPELLGGCRFFLGDRAYDDTKLLQKLWSGHSIKPVIDIRNLWQDGEQTRLVTGQENVVYDYRGQVYCHCPVTDRRRSMPYGGFEKDRQTLKYRCPAWHHGLECAGREACPVSSSIRIPLAEDPRVFTPLARSSYHFEKVYAQRTAVERVNSRLEQSFGFEQHYIRGYRKMKLRCGLALIVMLAMALGRIREQEPDKMRSLVDAA